MEDNNSYNDPFKHFFKIDVGWISQYMDFISKILKEDILNDAYKHTKIEGFPYVSLPVNGYFPNNTVGNQCSLLYLGNNHDQEPIYKNPNTLKDTFKIDYVNHLTSNAVHFLKQPSYYNGMFDILN